LVFRVGRFERAEFVRFISDMPEEKP